MKETLENLEATIQNIEYDLKQDYLDDQEKLEAMICRQDLLIAKVHLEQAAIKNIFNNNSQMR